MVSVGFDTAVGDPVGGFAITPAGMAAIGRRIAAHNRPTLLEQEGGYLLVRLGENALAFLLTCAAQDLESFGCGLDCLCYYDDAFRMVVCSPVPDPAALDQTVIETSINVEKPAHVGCSLAIVVG